MMNFWKNNLTDDEIKILLFIVIFAILGMGVRYAALTAEENSQQISELELDSDYEIKYDLQTVTKKELMTIPGIGDKRATDIISYRDQHGFKAKKDLMSVKGIGNATFEKIENYFNDFGEKDPDQMTASLTPEKKNQLPAETSIININNAPIEELTLLKGIGRTKAEAIIEYRQINHKFLKVDDLLKVKGIGQKTLEKIRDQITVE